MMPPGPAPPAFEHHPCPYCGLKIPMIPHGKFYNLARHNADLTSQRWRLRGPCQGSGLPVKEKEDE